MRKRVQDRAKDITVLYYEKENKRQREGYEIRKRAQDREKGVIIKRE